MCCSLLCFLVIPGRTFPFVLGLHHCVLGSEFVLENGLQNSELQGNDSCNLIIFGYLKKIK
jgi:hypothetical protein